MILFKFFSLVALFIIFMVFFFILTAIGNIRSIVRQFRNMAGNTATGNSQSTHRSNTKGQETVYNSTSRHKGKIIPHDEGEYVDYEEIK